MKAYNWILKLVLGIILATLGNFSSGQTHNWQQKEKQGNVLTQKQLQPDSIAKSRNLLSDHAYSLIVKYITKDKEGNLWFATSWTGVFRYNGRSFTHFTQKDGLCSNEVNTIYGDKSGKLWFGTNNGVCTFNGKNFSSFFLPETHAATAFTPNYGTQKLAAPAIVSIMQDKTGNMWFGIWDSPGNAGALRYNGKTFTRFLPEKPIQGILEDNSGGIWLNSKRLNGKSLTDYSGKKDAFKEAIFCSLKDQAGNLWFGIRDNGLYCYNGKIFSYFSKKDGLFDNRVSCIFQDRTGRLWLGSDIKFGSQKGELCAYKGKSFRHFPEINKLGMYSIWAAAEDKNGNIWFGGRGGKLCRYNGKTFTDFSKILKD